MSKFTPGPWHVGGMYKCTIYDHMDQRIANSFDGILVTQRSDAECEANARLIAAAPDLHEALQFIESLYDDEKSVGELAMALYEARNMARAALAKVEG
jgi:hypothetical protein